ncbi:DUF2797 domain-containing protein [Effusibacillus lacus]|uniref:DUF2797 domain-containing protein n=1 Tax=Effusibacillus lacus TaxID=1348429 RepID=A0A292YRK0_9BACL|nr:DUF2797 domain-containing protein [Effusibacillus lacus]TCS76269.1 uncharacterized protein DUF2797 [Effusibacillus lacus]GAX91816.1 hypothetical protein EFBL_3507 [Effusibacillus lacus]
MSYVGYLSDLEHEPQTPVQYFLPLGDRRIHLNPWIGQSIKIDFLGEKACCACGRKANKLFNNGYCYPCFTKLAECDLCIVKPHQCHYHLGTCRDNEFAETNCMTPHFVYLALSSGVKVGLTRKSRGLARWIDQGAVQAIPIAEAPSRKAAGEMEYWISQHLPDKTDWRKMLTGKVDQVDLLEIREQIRQMLPPEFATYLLDERELYNFTYPILETLEKIKSLSFDKQESIEGRLIGVKGQYLIMDHSVLNIKKHTGYKVEVKLG